MTPRQNEMADLYEEIAPQLRRVLQANLRASDWVIDDAMQTAWETLLGQPAEIERSRVLGWLATTSRREALAMMRRAQSELTLDDAPGAHVERADPTLEQSLEFWDRLGQVRRLSRRQQRIIWLRGLGFEHAEIAARTGESRRSVDRQLTQARGRLRTAA